MATKSAKSDKMAEVSKPEAPKQAEVSKPEAPKQAEVSKDQTKTAPIITGN